MNAFKKDFLVYLLLSVMFLLVYFVLIPVGIEPPVEGMGEVTVTPYTWPKACTLGIICFLLALTCRAYRQWRAQPEGGPGETSAWKPVLISFAIFFLYYLSVSVLGFTGASGLFSGLYAYLCGVRHKVLLAMIVVVIPVGLYEFFFHIAQVPMPTSPLGFI